MKGQMSCCYGEDVLNVIWPHIRNALFSSGLGHTNCIGIIYSKKGNFKSWSMYNGTLIQPTVPMRSSLLALFQNASSRVSENIWE